MNGISKGPEATEAWCAQASEEAPCGCRIERESKRYKTWNGKKDEQEDAWQWTATVLSRAGIRSPRSRENGEG